MLDHTKETNRQSSIHERGESSIVMSNISEQFEDTNHYSSSDYAKIIAILLLTIGGFMLLTATGIISPFGSWWEETPREAKCNELGLCTDSNNYLWAISLFGIATVGICLFFVLQRASEDFRQKHQTTLEFARLIQDSLKIEGVNDLTSEEGRNYMKVVQSLKDKFQEEDLNIDEINGGELNELVSQIAESAKSMVGGHSPQFWSKDTITTPQLKQSIADVVQDVMSKRIDDSNDRKIKAFVI